MQRNLITPRPNWQKTVESQGMYYHTSVDGPYWDESVYYHLENFEVDALEECTYWLNQYCLQAVDYIIDNNLFDKVGVPESHIDWIKQSWERDEHTIYGRFDLSFNDNKPKLLEYNADTPTGLLEASVIQWYWLKDVFPDVYEQYNSIHDKLLEILKQLHSFHTGKFYFAALRDNLEDFMTVNYLRDCAIQSGWDTEYLHMENVGWHPERSQFVDNDENTIRNIFKLYPWEWMVREQFADQLLLNTTNWFEAPWKTLLSNKGLLVVLHEMFPTSPYILPASWTPLDGSCVKKPVHGREGANITLMSEQKLVLNQTDGPYDGPCIYQQTEVLPCFDGNYPVIGSWLINGYAAGIGIREDKTRITTNTSRFVPHIFTP